MISQRRLFWTWLPTAFGSSMLVLEIPLVFASVARSADGGRALAALGICLAILMVVNTPALALAPLVVTTPVRRVRGYAVVVGLLGSLVLLGLGVAPVAGALLGLDADLTAAVQAGLLGLVPNSAAVAIRRYLHGRLIDAGRTRPITTATVLRIVGSGALAWAAVTAFPAHGALVGGLALSAGAFTEAALLAVAVRGLPVLPDRAGVALVRRHGQLSTSWLLNMSPALVTTVGIAHAAGPAVSLVVWPVLYELAKLFASPTADWESVTATTLRRDPGDGAPGRLTGWLAAGFVAAFGTVQLTSLDELYLRALIAVPPEPAALGLQWAPLLLPVPALWLLRGYLRGVAMATLRTRSLAWAGAVHLAVLVAAVAGLGATSLPGVGVGTLAVLAGLFTDIAVTAVLLRLLGWTTREPAAGAR